MRVAGGRCLPRQRLALICPGRQTRRFGYNAEAMRLVTTLERVLIALGPSRNIVLLELDEPVSSSQAVAQVMAWVDAWPRFGMAFRACGPWHCARQASIDPVRHVVAVEAGDAALETLLVATLTGTLDPDIPPWQVVLTNPADGNTPDLAASSRISIISSPTGFGS